MAISANHFIIALVVISSFALIQSVEEDFLRVPSVAKYGEQARKGEKLDFIDHFFLDVLPTLVGQAPNNENGTAAEFEAYAWDDESNDDAAKMSGNQQRQLILRSGYKFEAYDVVADDGYVTEMLRLINPLADRRYLKWPPVLLEHGGTVDQTAYMVASSIQHHPEPWPRTKQDGPMTSWNRSLAFTLANNGYDVWIAETRGSDDQGKRVIKSKSIETVITGENALKNLTVPETVYQLLRGWNFWGFSQDDIIAHEIKSHMDLVLKETNSTKVSLMTYSFSAPTTLAFFSLRPDYARKVQGYISMAPIFGSEGSTGLIDLAFNFLCPLIPDNIGTLVLSDIILAQPTRDLVVWVAESRKIRYSLIKSFMSMLFGSSPKYATLLELNLLGHMLRKLSFKQTKQACQQMRARKLQKFDYGPIKNKLLYNSAEPPVYDLSNLQIKDWVIVSAQNDVLSTQKVVEKLIQSVNPKPRMHIVAPGLSHLDLMAGVENDKYVNLPILNYLDSVSELTVHSDGRDYMTASSARQFDFKSILPAELYPEKLSEHTQQLTKTVANLTSQMNNPEQFVETVQKNFFKFISTFLKVPKMDEGNKDDKY